MIQMNGPAFEGVDNRILSLQLVKLGMTEAVIFTPDGVNRQAADILYKKIFLQSEEAFALLLRLTLI